MGMDFELVLEPGLSEQLDLGKSIPIPIDNYEDLRNLPMINGITLIGNKTDKQLNIQGSRALTNEELEAIIEAVFA